MDGLLDLVSATIVFTALTCAWVWRLDTKIARLERKLAARDAKEAA